MRLISGYRRTGVVVHHYTNSICHAYTPQMSFETLYWRLFGVFPMASPLVTPAEHRSNDSVHVQPTVPPSSLEVILRDSTFSVPPSVARQITRVKLPTTQRCEFHVLGLTEWGLYFPVEDDVGHIAVINGNSVTYRQDVTMKRLLAAASSPRILGIPDLQKAFEKKLVVVLSDFT
ncbi:hypothetical protein SPRG_10185 [Saprolegnia parasitica CBS 223.65]|uniref:Uncharacterized protein n=1 Tax=Saprolegnia parasitica (strain CBS 223.65) TaxID=695850 RepID=A0A067CCX8_SAPPC|nr:hypothetical protein SPRG_10185 [Saprolegnia parasitica CBS 223.65]KDO24652.1 hypothetical protein SPRG_10185 [Saprolegnia parasitica CBS 223.65]|eukprot:XP_012204720.1 hypothetical protein SPRG_10185 [Saprolegnia parasitica CBS 223.65]